MVIPTAMRKKITAAVRNIATSNPLAKVRIFAMMFEDLECCDNGHRENILDKQHTHVSIGIAYDEYYIALVQNFEDNYVTYVSPFKESSGYIEVSGYASKGQVEGMGIFYDEYPTSKIYERDRNRTSYDPGEFVAVMLEPPPLGYYYNQPSNYTIIEPNRWQIDGKSFGIAFNLYYVMQKKGIGVYTVVLILEDQGDVIVGSNYSIFKSIPIV